jgi:hypothetical protein
VEFGIRGSLATGWSWDKRNNQQGRPWDGNRFDVDAFVKNDSLCDGIPPSSPTFISLRRIDEMEGFKPGQPGNGAANLVINLIVQAEASLRRTFGSRLSIGQFTFKVFRVSSGVTGLQL